MFGGVARRRGGRDAAVVALWLALFAGFLAEVTPAASRAPADARPAFAALAAPAPLAARRGPARAQPRTAAAGAERPCPE
jgi:hypothetical protein